MLSEYEKFRFVDEAKGGEFYAEVNWNPKDKKSNKCQLIRFTFPNGEVAIVRRDVLNAVLFTMGTEEMQRKMIPQTIHKNWWYETTVSVRAKQPIAAGQLITFPIKLSMPAIADTVINEIKEDYAKGKIR